VSAQLESELREAFSLRASRVPPEAFDRLRAVDYRPRARRVAPPVKVTALAGAATAGAFAASTFLGGTQAAFAGWSPSPTSASAAQLSSVEATCQQHLAGLPAPPGAVRPGSWHEELTDVRGPFAFTVYQDQGGRNEATCFTGPGFTLVRNAVVAGTGMSVSGADGGPAGAGAGTVESEGAAAAGGIEHFNVALLALPGGGRYTLVEGRTRTDVSGVALVRHDGSTVEATTQNGRFVAWWPKTEPVTAAEVTTASGTVREDLGPPPPARATTSGACGASARSAPGPVPCKVVAP
jgi:hypothetical protein